MHLSKKAVANHLALLIAMLDYARDLKWLAEVPRTKKPRVRVHSKDFLQSPNARRDSPVSRGRSR